MGAVLERALLHPLRSDRNRSSAPGRRCTLAIRFPCVPCSVETPRCLSPSSRSSMVGSPCGDRTDLGHGLTPIKNGDRPSLPNVPQDFRETCFGFICGVADIHGPYYN